MTKIVTVLISLSIIIPLNSFARAGVAAGKIFSINIKETGYILITLEAPHANPSGCEQNKVIAIANNHIAKKEILSVALSAYATRKPVSFWVASCYEYYGTSYPLGVTGAIYQE